MVFLKKTLWEKICFALLIMFSCHGFAGWNSTGSGDLSTEANNPWFLENTKTVRYCIAIDRENFGQTVDVARAKIAAAFDYWHQQFAGTVVPEAYIDGEKIGTINVHLASQAFTEVECGSGEDIVFQLGTLSAQQAQFLSHPARVVAQAIQTAYDPVNLRAKGVIYLSPERGPFALQGNGLLNTPLMPHRWSYAEGKVLELVLMHEIGHTFGIPHTSEMLMAASFPANVISTESGLPLTAELKWPWTLLPKEELADEPAMIATSYTGDSTYSSINDDDAAQILGLPKDWHGKILLQARDNKTLGLYRSADNNEAPQLVGTLSNGQIALAPLGLSTKIAIEIYLTPAQRVFPFKVPVSGLTTELQYEQSVSKSFLYTPANGGLPWPLLIQQSAESLTFLGVNAKRSKIASYFFLMTSKLFADVTDSLSTESPPMFAPLSPAQRAKRATKRR